MLANLDSQDQKEDNRLKCAGMYSRKSWGGSVDPFILVKFLKPPAEQKAASVSLVIFEWKDEELVGVFPEGAAPGTPVCTTSMFYTPEPLLTYLSERIYLHRKECPEEALRQGRSEQIYSGAKCDRVVDIRTQDHRD